MKATILFVLAFLSVASTLLAVRLGVPPPILFAFAAGVIVALAGVGIAHKESESPLHWLADNCFLLVVWFVVSFVALWLLSEAAHAVGIVSAR